METLTQQLKLSLPGLRPTYSIDHCPWSYTHVEIIGSILGFHFVSEMFVLASLVPSKSGELHWKSKCSKSFPREVFAYAKNVL